jgi:hypothetical protein
MASTRQKSRGIMSSLRAYTAGRRAKKEADRQKYREQYGPTLGDTVRDVGRQTADNARNVAETVAVTSYVIYDDTRQKASDLYDKSKDKAQELSDKFMEVSGRTKDAVTERLQSVRDNIALKRDMYKERMNNFFNKVSDRYSAMKEAIVERYHNSKETVLDKYNEAKQAVVNGATMAVGAGAMVYDKGVAASAAIKEKASDTVENGRRSMAERLNRFADKLNPDVVSDESNDFTNDIQNDLPDVAPEAEFSRRAKNATENIADARSLNDNVAFNDRGNISDDSSKPSEPKYTAKVTQSEPNKIQNKIALTSDGKAVAFGEMTNPEAQPPKAHLHLEGEPDTSSKDSTKLHDGADKGVHVTVPEATEAKGVRTKVPEATVSNSLVSDKDVDSLAGKQAGKAINRSIKALKNGDKEEALNRFAEWYMSLDDQNKEIVKDVLDNKKEPTDVIGNAQAYRTRYGFDPKVGAIAFFNALREPTMETHLATQDLKQATNDIDTYIDAQNKIEWADAVMSNVEGEYSFLNENKNNALLNNDNVYDGDIDEPVRTDTTPRLDTPAFVKEPDSEKVEFKHRGPAVLNKTLIGDINTEFNKPLYEPTHPFDMDDNNDKLFNRGGQGFEKPFTGFAKQVPTNEPIMADPNGEVFLQSEQPNITFTHNDVKELKDLGKSETKSQAEENNDFGLTAADFASLQETEQTSEAPFAL